ncbi:MAG: hypothetical protein JXA33_00770 [Anaerolineae bacterium]|nr:hypothetical protein [Anaerolineae bacterium]
MSAGDHVYLAGHNTLGWTTDGSWPFILPDALGSVRQTTSITGAVTGSREWSPFEGRVACFCILASSV